MTSLLTNRSSDPETQLGNEKNCEPAAWPLVSSSVSCKSSLESCSMIFEHASNSLWYSMSKYALSNKSVIGRM